MPRVATSILLSPWRAQPAEFLSFRSSMDAAYVSPNAVRYNDWREASVPDVSTFNPSVPLSVIVPYYDAPSALARTLAALERQNYPRELFEVVIVDDGSPTPLTSPSTTLDVVVVRQEDWGFGLARARNNGATAASHEILIFLDCDMMAESDYLLAHARWHHCISDALTLGLHSYADATHLSPDGVRNHRGPLGSLFESGETDPPWNRRHLIRTEDLTTKHDDLFRMVQGGNFGIRKEFYQVIGGSNESFTSYGGEDTEMAYRAYASGGLLVPLREASAWHQGRWAENRVSKRKALAAQRDRLANFVPVPGFRSPTLGRIYDVPRHIVTVEMGDQPTDRIVEAVQLLLSDPEGDLVIRIEAGEGGVFDERAVSLLHSRFGSDPRVRVAPTRTGLEEYPMSPFHVRMAATRTVLGAFQQLQRRVVDRVAVTIAWGSGEYATIERAWGLHRACRTGLPLDTFGDVATFRLRNAPVAKAKRPKRWPRHGSGFDRVLAELWRVRGLRSAWHFLRWLEAAVRWRFGRRM